MHVFIHALTSFGTQRIGAMFVALSNMAWLRAESPVDVGAFTSKEYHKITPHTDLDLEIIVTFKLI